MPARTGLVGRRDELARLALLFREDTDRAVVVQGESGVGKTTLIEQVCAQATAEGWRVVRVLGVEAEEPFALGGLNQLAFGLVDFTPGLTEQDAAVLAPVFGGDSDTTPSVLSLTGAVLNLLGLAAQTTPVLLVVDDVQWLDGISAEVLGAVGRRLTDPRVRILVGRRVPEQSVFTNSGWSELEVAPLKPPDAEQLLERVAGSLPATTRTAILTAAAGNPLALTELPRFADRIDWGVAAIPLTERLVGVFGGRLEQLHPDVRAELLRASLDGIANGRTQSGTRARYVMNNAEPAIEAGLLITDPLGEIVFRHPLVPAAIVHRASPQERRGAHRDLAELYGDVLVRRASHLAASATEPDQDVADLLGQAAQLSLRRGGLPAAIEWLRRAAELSTSTDRRSAFLAEAVFAATRAGRISEARELLGNAEPDTTEWALEVLTDCYRAIYADGEVISTHRRLLDVLTGADAIGTMTLNRLVNLLFFVTGCADDERLRDLTNAAVHPLLSRLAPLVLLYRTDVEDILGSAKTMRANLDGYVGVLSQLPSRWVLMMSYPAYCIDFMAGFRAPLREAFSRLSEHGASIDAVQAGRVVLLDLIATGDWDNADEVGARCLEMASQVNGSQLVRQTLLADLGVLAASRGEARTAREYAAEVTAWSAPRGLRNLLSLADRVAVRVALAEADYETAYQSMIRIGRPGQFPRHDFPVGDAILDFVESAVRTGRMAEAREHVAEAVRLKLAEVSPRVAALIAAASALTASGSEADELYRSALAHPGLAEHPFEHARITLAQGMWLRRKLRHSAARDSLVQALDTFDRLGARPWADRARAELAAAGAAAADPRSDGAVLSPQERRVAELAAAGQSSKQIAAQLSISSRTVDAHLSGIFRKLGVNRRARLGAALQNLDTST
ncbi:MAG: ATP-binding protein [Mycobacterium sp.]